MGDSRGVTLFWTYREETAHDGHCKSCDGHIEGLFGGQTRLLEEVCGISAQGITIEDLNTVDSDANEGSVKVKTLEESPVRCLRILLPFVLRRGYHQGNSLVDIEVDVFRRGETLQYVSSFLYPAFTNEPPWRLGRKINKRH